MDADVDEEWRGPDWDGGRPADWTFNVVIPDRAVQSRSWNMTWEERFPPLDPPAPLRVSNEERFPADDWCAPKQPVRPAVTRNSFGPRRKPSGPSVRSKTYLIGIEGSPLVKIGYTSAEPKDRLRGMQTGLPFELTLLWFTKGDFEDELHDIFAEHRVRGEWFDLTPLGDPVQIVRSAVAEIRMTVRTG